VTASGARPFLTAKWRYLALLNYAVDPDVVAPLVPPGTELDTFEGVNYASLVGLVFFETRVLGISIPLHRDFEEVNLRFYVRRKTEDGWRRGVVFVKELVPRALVARIANTAYGENYRALPMSCNIDVLSDRAIWGASYSWTHAGRDTALHLFGNGLPVPPEPGSTSEFLAEHYWGYIRARNGTTTEYRVDHAPWTIRPASRAELNGDVSVFGERFVEPLSAEPASAFLATGSEVSVFRGVRLE
jgi:uncharacterized protein YqjF (DUF2071 family)